jgi:hypothetical protein
MLRRGTNAKRNASKSIRCHSVDSYLRPWLLNMQEKQATLKQHAMGHQEII